MAKQQRVPSSGNRLLGIFGMVMLMGILCLASPWFWLDALFGLVFLTYLFFWGIASVPNEEYYIDLEEGKDPTL